MYYNLTSVLPFKAGINAAANPEEVSDTLGNGRALILERRGQLTVGTTMESATAYYIRLEHLCHAQMTAEAASRRRGEPLVPIGEDVAKVRPLPRTCDSLRLG